MRKLATFTVGLLILLTSILIDCAAATPTQYSVNGNWYDAVEGACGISWSEAKTEAESSSYLGMNGHLATVASQGENDFIVNTFGVNDYFLGGFQPAGSSEPNGNWQWVTDEPWVYTNWDTSGEPDNYYRGEYGTSLYPIGSPENILQFHRNNMWNDLPDGIYASGYIVEYEGQPLVANFKSNVTEGYAPLTVKFTDTSTGSPISWSWNFGDYYASNTQNPVHTYEKPGKYTINLTVGNVAGSSDTITKSEFIIVKKSLVITPSNLQFLQEKDSQKNAWIDYPRKPGMKLLDFNFISGIDVPDKRIKSIPIRDVPKIKGVSTDDYQGSKVNWGQCVSFVKALSHSELSTYDWSSGSQVVATPDLKPGTVIATFNSKGEYANLPGESHAAVFSGFQRRNGVITGIIVWDQNYVQSKTVGKHVLPTSGNGENNALNYHVVELNK